MRAAIAARSWRRISLVVIVVAWMTISAWQACKPLPPGLDTSSAWQPAAPGGVSFIADITAADAYGRPVVSQAIFDQALAIVHSARSFIVLDYFLFNADRLATPAPGAPRLLSEQLRDALLQRRREQPGLRVLFITDPINARYGDRASADLQQLRAAGIDVVVTDLERLRDSNFIYSGLWRLAIRWWIPGGHGGHGDHGGGDHGGGRGWLPNPLDESNTALSFGAWSRLMNFKANHRNVLIADDGHGRLVSVVGSASPHDASAEQSNVAFRIADAALPALLQSELAIARFSGWQGRVAPLPPAVETTQHSARSAIAGPRVQVLTEGAIRSAILQRLNAAGTGETIEVAMLYLADRGIVEALARAARRGVTVRLILDPNKDAFGQARSGIPNQPVASELVAASDGAIHVRWYRTHGEQFHTKLVMVCGAQRLWAILGSANLTRRDLGDYSLAADVAVDVERTAPLAEQMLGYFNALWSNRAGLGIEYTADFGYYADPSQLDYWWYRLLEGSGFATF